jgi:hypothetical protein
MQYQNEKPNFDHQIRITICRRALYIYKILLKFKNAFFRFFIFFFFGFCHSSEFTMVMKHDEMNVFGNYIALQDVHGVKGGDV